MSKFVSKENAAELVDGLKWYTNDIVNNLPVISSDYINALFTTPDLDFRIAELEEDIYIIYDDEDGVVTNFDEKLWEWDSEHEDPETGLPEDWPFTIIDFEGKINIGFCKFVDLFEVAPIMNFYSNEDINTPLYTITMNENDWQIEIEAYNEAQGGANS